MPSENLVALDIHIIAPDITLRQLETLRLALFDRLEATLAGEQFTIHQETSSRSLDPVIVGAIALAVLPVIVEKALDELIDFVKKRRGLAIMVNVPRGYSGPILIDVSADRNTILTTIEADVQNAVTCPNTQ